MTRGKPDFCKRCPVGGIYDDSDQTCSVADPEDGLPLACVGEWAEQKHARVRKYVDISRATRRKFLQGVGGATYIDPFCGPGRARIRGTRRIIDGSVVVAAKEALASDTPFTEIHIADADDSFLAAAEARVQKLEVNTRAYAGAAGETIKRIAATLPKYGLHFAFLDPYDLKSLPFTIIRELAAFKHMDILIHVSEQDLQRNLRRYMEWRKSPLDSFAPEWRKNVKAMEREANIRSKIFQYWLALIRSCDMQPAQGVEQVSGSKKQHLYWLVFVARHNLALSFWEDIRNVASQQALF